MLELLSSGFLSLWLEKAGLPAREFNAFSLLAGPGIPGWTLPVEPQPATIGSLEKYLQTLTAKGLSKNAQGVWLQTNTTVLANNQGTTPLSAASLTKIATSIAALEKWGPTHQFTTVFSATGPIEDGVLKGDLIVTGGGDPFFIWEEAFAVGNALNKLGIKQVTGNLIINGNFSVNFEQDPLQSGQQFIEALNPEIWQEDASFVYSSLPPGTPKPKLEINGTVKLGQTKGKPLLRHYSLPLSEIIRQMNIHSNNEIAQMLADGVGGANVVKDLAVKAAGVPPEEILLINGSGLGQENRISPRAACAMYIALQRYLYQQPDKNYTIADIFPVAGKDEGTVEDRKMPKASVVKTGTLSNVSALAGMLPTKDYGVVYFAIINNRGEDIDGLRAKQDSFLQTLQKQFGGNPTLPLTAIAPGFSHSDADIKIGDVARNEIVTGG
ncbi:D-alanyl-D-alanine carboxypeptidase [Ancylothrix sp. C2]|uniref:D-alanyl-D-alanine carboxypeptidase n=1 Tax=Ancylothrix sp. D3o TaxID=2953691 RepID=UPI0021BB627D|nr:D-alanyl-D-alanine carboxypeptidase [Ancylothrix sp. D3o]MCT7952092.1 D-alanyl-D-alanine carboxypeptidase [Ancylothrix sp. D3o]